MRTIFFCSILAVCLGLVLAACEGTSNMSINTNRVSNTLGNAANTVGNTASNAVNSMSNAISKATTNGPESFFKDAAQGGMAEVEMGKVAVKNAQSPEVKKFGQMMVDDHSKANKELEDLAKKKNIALPADIGSNKSTLDKLNGLKGADFDKEYVKDMVDDHETDVAEFEKQAANATDPDVKAFAAKTLPVLKKHLDAIKAIQAKMK